MNPEKTEQGLLVFSRGCFADPDEARSQFMNTKKRFGKLEGVQAYHWDICLAPGEGSPETVMEIAKEWTEKIIGEDFQTVIAVHTDKHFYHAHIIFNSVSLIDGHKFRDSKNDIEEKYYPLLNGLCVERGLSFIDLDPSQNERVRQATYKEWMEHKKGAATWRDMIMNDVDNAIAGATDFRMFCAELEKMGYEVNLTGKHISVMAPGMKRNIRLYSLGKDYSEHRIIERLKTEMAKPQRRFTIEKRYYAKKRIPVRRKRPLTYFERQYYRYAFMFGRMKRQNGHISLAAVQEGKKIAEQRNFLFFNGYKDMAEAKAGYEKMNARVGELDAERDRIKKERRKYEPLFAKFHEAMLEQNIVTGEYTSRGQTILYELAKEGYVGEPGLQKIRDLKKSFDEAFIDLRQQKSKLTYDISIMERVLEDDVAAKTDRMETAYAANEQGRSQEYAHTKESEYRRTL